MQPDTVTLYLDMKGIIQDVNLSSAIEEGGLDAWIGRPWTETVADIGADKVRRMVEEACSNQVSMLRQVTQRFPGGRELLMEYTTVRLGGNRGLIAIGKSMQAVADLQSRLIAAQQTMERDYWKLRQFETRYRLLFDTSNEAVLLVRERDTKIVDANPVALRALGLAGERQPGIAGRDLLSELSEPEHGPLLATLRRAREQGRAPRFLLHIGQRGEPWLVRASLMTSDPETIFLLQLSPAEGAVTLSDRAEPLPMEDLIERLPDGFVVLDKEGVVVSCNRAFLELIQVGAEGGVVGERIGRWLGRPGADLTVLLASVRRHGVVRLFSTTLHGEFGTETEVEISAAGAAGADAPYIGVLIRDVGRRLSLLSDEKRLSAMLSELRGQLGQTTLRKLIAETVGLLERHFIEGALELTGGNRTAAAELLGLSRQSLYTKIDRYGIEAEARRDLVQSG